MSEPNSSAPSGLSGWQKLMSLLRWHKPHIRPIEDPSRVRYDLRKCELFRDVPEESVREAVSKMEQVVGRPGDVILREGEEGDYYYLMLQGRAAVVRKPARRAPPVVVAELDDGACFGEESLIAHARRNATIRFTTRGVVWRLPREAFLDYIQKALTKWLTPMGAAELIHQGARWMEIQAPHQVPASHMPGAIIMPLAELRERFGELDRKTDYVCYCVDGRFSSVAGFLLTQRGFKACVLRGGLDGIRQTKSGATQAG